MTNRSKLLILFLVLLLAALACSSPIAGSDSGDSGGDRWRRDRIGLGVKVTF